MRLALWILLPALVVSIAFAVLVFLAERTVRRGNAVAGHRGDAEHSQLR